MKVFIDANIYLDFYRSNNEALKIFDELLRGVSSIILTDQIINEFYRNREVVLKTVKAKFITETQIESFSSSYLQGLKEFAELNELKKEYNKKRKEIEGIINNCINNPSVDPIYQHFSNLINSKDAIIYETSKEIMDLAYQRKLKGNPPLSDKYSIGDEINWELLVSNTKDDLIIVARDSTFKDHLNFLKYDFNRNTGKAIIVLTEKITSALQMLGKELTGELKEIEDKQINDLKITSNRWKITSVLGNTAMVFDGNQYGYTVLEPKGADLSFLCGNCGSYGPWWGNRCLTCGVMSDD